MKKVFPPSFLIATLGIMIHDSYTAIGQSAVITLVFPYGARSYAMGEVGTALYWDDWDLEWWKVRDDAHPENRPHRKRDGGGFRM